MAHCQNIGLSYVYCIAHKNINVKIQGDNDFAEIKPFFYLFLCTKQQYEPKAKDRIERHRGYDANVFNALNSQPYVSPKLDRDIHS